MKISVITVLNASNYGSVLQAFATQRFFESLGLEVEFVDYWRKNQVLSARIGKILARKQGPAKKLPKKLARNAVDMYATVASGKMFRRFVTSNLHLTPQRYFSNRDLCRNIPRADVYATGSDQMWNSDWNQGIEKSYYLDFAPEGKKRIAFSTSIGKTQWSREEADAVIPYLKKYDFITVREQSAVDLLESCGIRSELIPDPTLLLDRSQWDSILPERLIKEPYLLVYQLHQVHDRADFAAGVDKVAKALNLRVVRVTYSPSSSKGGRNVCLPDPFSFLSLIRDADYVFTDSFHGTAFSVNFRKPFAAVYPKEFSTRIDNLLTIADLHGRRYTDDSDIQELMRPAAFDKAVSELNDRRMKTQSIMQQLLCLG